jgi:hypothetical protein
MKHVFPVLLFAVVLFGCASGPEAAPEVAVVEEPAVESAPEPSRPAFLESSDVVEFRTAAGTVLATTGTVTLPTGGPPSGTVVPTSRRTDVTLFLTRDGSVPSETNNWGGGFTPDRPLTITRQLEGVTVYRLIAAAEGFTSDPLTVTVSWKHEENVELPVPRFVVSGSPVIGSVELPVSDGTVPSARLVVESEYSAATIYVTRDGSTPSPDNYWYSGIADGTYIWAPETTVGDYRAVAVWQGSTSPVAALRVEWQ